MTSSTKETFLRDYIRRITFSIQNNFSSFLLCLISQNCCNRCQRSLKVVCLVITHTHTHSYLSLSLSSLSLSSLFFTHRQTHRQTYTHTSLLSSLSHSPSYWQTTTETDRQAHTHLSSSLKHRKTLTYSYKNRHICCRCLSLFNFYILFSSFSNLMSNINSIYYNGEPSICLLQIFCCTKYWWR